MSATALPHELRGAVPAGIGGAAAEAARMSGTAVVPAELLPECTCIVGDCERDHDNE